MEISIFNRNTQEVLLQLLNLTSEEQFMKLDSSSYGLTAKQAHKRLSDFGKNEISHKYHALSLSKIFTQVKNPLIGILLIAVFFSAIAKDMTSAYVITIIIAVSIVIDYFQNHKAIKAIHHLQEQVAVKVDVLRDYVRTEIQSKYVVPGDIIYLNPGDIIPADAILISTNNFYVQQANLTGESTPVQKNALGQSSKQNITESENLIFAGTVVLKGNATALVITTGKRTLFGQVHASVEPKLSATVFEKDIYQFGIFILKLVILLVIFILGVSSYLERNFTETFLFAVSLAVALTPEFLPMIISITLASGSMKMSRKGVIIKNQAAIQSFGSIDILCSDKTGTLTTGELNFSEHLNYKGESKDKIFIFSYLTGFFNEDKKDPLNKAVISKFEQKLKEQLNLLDIYDTSLFKKIAEIPFDPVRKLSSLILAKEDKHYFITKGAPENIFQICDRYEIDEATYPFSEEIRNQCFELFTKLSSQGLRVLSIAYQMNDVKSDYSIEDEKNLIFLGFLVFQDRIYPEIIETIRNLKQEGISLKILTGDNDLVAKQVGLQVGLLTNGIVLGQEIEPLSNLALAQLAEKTQIFARMTPVQKQRVIMALQSYGHVVGYIGDGVNDVPALRVSDVGISVMNAVDAAKESADVIILNRNLKLLNKGVKEGRRAFGNVMKYMLMSTSSNFGNILSMAGAVLFLPFLPMLPSQILLNNFLYDLAQISIPSDKVDKIFINKPRRWNINLIKRFMLAIGPISTLFDFITFFILLKVFHAAENLFQTGWFIESLATQVLVIFIIRTGGNPFSHLPSGWLILTAIMSLVIGIFLPFSPIYSWFGFTPLPLSYFVFLTLAVTSYLILVQYLKKRIIWKWMQKYL